MSSLFDETVLVFDGAMGTELYQRGFFINRPFEELNLTSPRDVQNVHRDYIAAGAQVITTNSFGVTKAQLKNFDIEDQQAAIVRSALQNANVAIRESSKLRGGDVHVAFSMGPLGNLLEPLGSVGLDEARLEFEQVARIAVDAEKLDFKNFGFDLFVLETFSNIDEVLAAIEGIRRVDLTRPILASVHVRSSQTAFLQSFVERVASRDDVQMIGVNCSEGPSDLYTVLKKIVETTNKPVVVQPNAGLPRQVNGRYFYMTSPDYLAKYAKRYVALGAFGVGGCCGTGPEHTRAIASSVQMGRSQRRSENLARAERTVGIGGAHRGTSNALNSDANREVSAGASSGSGFVSASTSVQVVAPVVVKERTESFVLQQLKAKKLIRSVEIQAPKGTDLTKFSKQLEALRAVGVQMVNVPDGARASTRVSSLHLAAFIQRACPGIHVMPHLTTRDRNLIALQSDLLGAHIGGVRDVLLVTGDPPKLGTNKDATGVYDIDSIGLTYLVKCLNEGHNPTGELLGCGTGFGIGVASNPTAINLDLEKQRWDYKVESGADFAVTQPIFDPEAFLRWKDKIGGTYRPQLVGIWPLLSLRNAEFMANEIPGVSVPDWVLSEMAKAGDNIQEAHLRGIEIARRVMEKLSGECEGFCVSAPLGKIDIALEAMKT